MASLLQYWVCRYVGAPDSIRTEYGSQFVAAEFQTLAAEMNISCSPVPVESAHSMGIGERYHGPVRRIFERLRIAHPSVDKDLVLDIAVKACNDTIGVDGLVPTLLLYGVYPRVPLKDAASGAVPQSQRLTMMISARDEYSSIIDELRLRTARSVQTATYPTDLVYNEPMMVFRTTSRRWEGPYRFLGDSPHGFMFSLPSGESKLYQKPAVRRYAAGIDYSSVPGPASVLETGTPRDGVDLAPPEESPRGHEETNVDSGEPPTLGLQPPESWAYDDESVAENAFHSHVDEYPTAKELKAIFLSRPYHRTPLELAAVLAEANVTEVLSSKYPQSSDFREAILEEDRGLSEKSVFEEHVVPQHHRDGLQILKSRYVLAFKNVGTANQQRKARLVVTAIKRLDKGSEDLFTHSQTTTKAATRILLSLSASLGTDLYTRDVSQAFVCSRYELLREVWIVPPKEAGRHPDAL
jgi:hypothetical protein